MLTLEYEDFIYEKPIKSGNYAVIDGKGYYGRDDYTTSNGGMWWNSPNDGTTAYSPSSYTQL